MQQTKNYFFRWSILVAVWICNFIIVAFAMINVKHFDARFDISVYNKVDETLADLCYSAIRLYAFVSFYDILILKISITWHRFIAICK